MGLRKCRTRLEHERVESRKVEVSVGDVGKVGMLKRDRCEGLQGKIERSLHAGDDEFASVLVGFHRFVQSADLTPVAGGVDDGHQFSFVQELRGIF